MSAVLTTAVVPLVTDPQGTIRVRGNRVTLDAIVSAFQNGATAEEISQKFPAIALADIYQIIAHYLNHSAEVDAYLSRRHTEAVALQRQAEEHFDPAGIRARLLARRNDNP
ncbi:MAG: DUF433 domain-containing protein [Steroidobacteraceae bacterium]